MKKGILQIILGNVVYLLISALINLILPKYMTLESYAVLKTYILYINYAGLFHLGIIDGIYLKYGGKNISEVQKSECKTDLTGLILLSLFFAFVILGIGFIFSSEILIAYSIGIISFNVLGFFKSFYSATGIFGKYSWILSGEMIVLFLCYLLLIYIGVNDDAIPYIANRIIILYILCLFCYFGLSLHKVNISGIKDVIKNTVNNIKQGILLMLGNFATVCFSGIDRWVVLLFINKRAFAIYAFAVSMEQIVNAFISPVTLAMYNYLCKYTDYHRIKVIKNLVTCWGFFLIILGFPTQYIVNMYLPKYKESTSLIFILFAAMAIHTIIKGVYLNIYKIERKQKIYFKQMIAMLVIATLLDLVFYGIFRNMISIAIATFIVSLIWLIICEFKDKRLRYNRKEILAVIVLSCMYLFCGTIGNPFLGVSFYLVSFALTVFLLMKEAWHIFLENILLVLKMKK